MNFPTLMHHAAERYYKAKQEVLQEWRPDCGCQEIGKSANCESCPSLAVFEDLVRDKISRAQPHEANAAQFPR